MPMIGWRLLPALTLALAPAFLFRTVWQVLTGDAWVLNDVLSVTDSWTVVIVTALVWTATVLLGVAVLDGGPQPLRRTLRALPIAFVGVAVLALLLIGSFVALAAILPAPPQAFFGLAIALALALIAVATSLSLVATVAVVEQSGFGAFSAAGVLRGRRWRTGCQFAFGALAPALIVGWIGGHLHPGGFVHGIQADLLRNALLVATAALQARTLLRLYRATRTEPDPGPRGRPARRWAVVLLSAGVFLLPTVVTGSVVAAAKVPRVSTSPDLQASPVMQIAWPAGRHPVIVTQNSILDCTDDRCSRYRSTPLPLVSYLPVGGAIVRPDGSVVALGDNALAICDADRHCEGGWQRYEIPALRTSRANAITLTPAGDLLIATATPSDDGTRTRLGIMRCHDPLCATSDTVGLGDAGPIGQHDGWNGRQLAIRLDSGGRPIVAFTAGSTVDDVSFGWCSSASCEQGKVGSAADGRLPADEVAALYRDLIRPCTSVCGGEYPGPAVDTPGGRYALEVRHRGPDNTLLQAGRPQDFVETNVLTCPDRSCRQPQRRARASLTPMGTSNVPGPGPEEIWLMAASAAGQIILVRPAYSPQIVTIVKP
jgi:hypothetical protein